LKPEKSEETKNNQWRHYKLAAKKIVENFFYIFLNNAFWSKYTIVNSIVRSRRRGDCLAFDVFLTLRVSFLQR